MKRLAILGSTGSIGVNTLKVVNFLRKDFEVTALSANSNIRLLARQAEAFRPKIVSVTDPALEGALKKLIRPGNIKVSSGEEGLTEIISRSDVDMVVFAVSGSVCLKPLIAAIKHRKKIALANKEALVSAGETVMREAAANGVEIIPIDSEHSAIFQCMEGRPRDFLSRIFLTSSGGPLLYVRRSSFKDLSAGFVLRHPKWKMGRKITVDSATLMNKGFEIIEARWLFGIDESRIDVLIHPEAIVHSLAELIDGTMLAQMAVPDMRLPIQFALTYPERKVSKVEPLDLLKAKELTFSKPDIGKFPCLGLAREALRCRGTYPAALVAADEEAVRYFLEGVIKFSRIPQVLEKVLARHRSPSRDKLAIADIFEADSWAREEARRLCCR